jgi:PmbA protein
MIVETLVDKAMLKAQKAQAMLRQSVSSEVGFENDRLKATRSAQKIEITLKVILENKIGTSTTTDVTDIDGVVQRALETAEFGSQVHFQLPEPQEIPQVKTCDQDVLPVTKTEMVQLGQEMVDRIKTYNPEILVNAGVYKRAYQTQFANSRGVRLSGENTDFGLGVDGTLVRGSDMLFAGRGLGRRCRQIDHLALADRAIHWFRIAERTAQIRSADMPIIFTPEGLAVLLLTLRLALDGKNVLLGQSPMKGKLGVQAMDTKFSLIDDPLVDYAAGSSAFSDEGLPRRRTPLIENGVLRSFMYDLDTAGRAGAQPTGHDTWRSPTNWIIPPGDTSNEEMIRNTKEGLLVHYLMGLGFGNPISGEFSVNVQLGYKIENGEIVGRVKNVMLAGNVFDALKDINAIGDYPEWSGGDWSFISMYAPPIKVNKLSVVAK